MPSAPARHPEPAPPAADVPAFDGLPRIGALIRERRQQARLTLRRMGEDAGLSVGYLSQIERDRATPSLATLAQIARALGVGIDYFIAAPDAAGALSRAAHRARFSIDGSSVIYERLSTEFPGSKLSAFLLHVPPGYHSETVSHEGEEILFILEGEITQWLDGAEIALRAGDALHFRGNQRHAWANRTPLPSRLLWTGMLGLFQPMNRAPEEPAAHPIPTEGETP